MAGSSKVDGYFDKQVKWEAAIRRLRAMVLDFDLAEELKWGCPCYTLDGSKIVLIHVFKDYCALLFFKGALLQDSHRILVQQTPNVQSARQIRFTGLDDVTDLEAVVRATILDAIAVDQSGLQVSRKTTAEFAMAEEFADALNERPALRDAFHALTPGRQRAYLLHFSSAKQSRTRAARVEKCMGRILEGKGLDDD
jgi:uncharacterized protein YdeI (YjbR/CyaY-like superfamily)